MIALLKCHYFSLGPGTHSSTSGTAPRKCRPEHIYTQILEDALSRMVTVTDIALLFLTANGPKGADTRSRS